MGNSYIRKQVEQATGMPARRVQFYTDAGLIKLDEQHTGRGKERHYSKTDMLRLLIIKELDKHGVTLSNIKKIFRDIDSQMKKKDVFNPERYAKDIHLGATLFIYGDSFEFQDLFHSDFSPEGYDVTVQMLNHESLIMINVRLLAERLLKNIENI